MDAWDEWFRIGYLEIFGIVSIWMKKERNSSKVMDTRNDGKGPEHISQNFYLSLFTDYCAYQKK